MRTLALTGLLCLHTGAPKRAPLKPPSVTSGMSELRDRICFVAPPPAAAATKHPGQGKAPTPRSRGGIIPEPDSPDTLRRIFTTPDRRWHGLGS